jgi:hypothetical protein
VELRTITNANHPFGPPGAPGIGTELTILGVGPDGKEILPILVEGATSHGAVQAAADDSGVFAIDLPVTDGSTPVSYYAVEVRSPALETGQYYVYRFVAPLPAGAGPLQWEDFYAPGTPVEQTVWSAFVAHLNDDDRHLPINGEDGEVVGHVGGVPAWTTVSGTGDMQALIYDPLGYATDAFNLGNSYGNLDGGTF